MTSKKKGLIALFIASIIWGACPPIFKLALENIPPFTLAYLRFFIALLFLFPFVYKKLHIEKQDLLQIFSVGFLGVSMNISLFFIGLTMSNSINAAVLGAAAPIFTIIGAAIFLREKTKRNILLGAIISAFGAILIILEPLILNGVGGSVLGNLLFVGSVLGAVGHTLIGRHVTKKYPNLVMTFCSFLVGTISFVPFSIMEVINNPGFIQALDSRAYFGIAFGGVFASLIAYSLWDFGLSKIPANETSVFSNINPIVAVLIAVPLLGEKITFPFVLGALLISLGLAIAEKKFSLKPVRELKDML